MNLQISTGSNELDNFYKKDFYFSYSSINKLLFSPRMFYNHYVLKQKEDSTDCSPSNREGLTLSFIRACKF
jgi:hypothetical protein